MIDPPRLLEDAPTELESSLLQAGRAYRPSPDTRAKALAALGLAGSAALLSKSSAAAGSLWSLKSLIFGGAVLTLAMGSAVVVLSSSARPTRDAPAVTTPQPDPVALPAEPRAPTTTSSATTVPAPRASQAAPPSEATPPTASGVPRAASITAELAAIDAARSALAAGDNRRALTLLDDHAKRFPRGRLSLEAEVLRIEALARSGQRAAASARAQAFADRYPSSVFTPRVKRFIGG